MCKSAYDALALQNNPAFATPEAHEQYLAEVARKSADYEDAQRALITDTADTYNGQGDQKYTLPELAKSFMLGGNYPDEVMVNICAHVEAISKLAVAYEMTRHDWERISAHIGIQLPFIAGRIGDRYVAAASQPDAVVIDLDGKEVPQTRKPATAADFGEAMVECGSPLTIPREFVHKSYHPAGIEPGATTVNLDGEVVDPLVENVMGPDFGENPEEIPVQIKGVDLKSN